MHLITIQTVPVQKCVLKKNVNTLYCMKIKNFIMSNATVIVLVWFVKWTREITMKDLVSYVGFIGGDLLAADSFIVLLMFVLTLMYLFYEWYYNLNRSPLYLALICITIAGIVQTVKYIIYYVWRW